MGPPWVRTLVEVRTARRYSHDHSITSEVLSLVCPSLSLILSNYQYLLLNLIEDDRAQEQRWGSHEGPPRSNDKELDETVASVETTPSKPDDSENLRLAEEIKAETAKIKKLKKENDKLEQVKKKKGKGKKGSTVKQSPVKESEDEVEVEYETRCDCH